MQHGLKKHLLARQLRKLTLTLLPLPLKDKVLKPRASTLQVLHSLLHVLSLPFRTLFPNLQSNLV